MHSTLYEYMTRFLDTLPGTTTYFRATDDAHPLNRVNALARLRGICNENASANTCCRYMAVMYDIAHRRNLAHQANLGEILSGDQLVLLKQLLRSNLKGVVVLMRSVEIVPCYTTLKNHRKRTSAAIATYALAAITLDSNHDHIVNTMMDPNATPESFYKTYRIPTKLRSRAFRPSCKRVQTSSVPQNQTGTRTPSILTLARRWWIKSVIRLSHLSPQMSLQRLLQQLPHLLLLIPHLLSQSQLQLTHLELQLLLPQQQQLRNQQLPTLPIKHYWESTKH